MSRFSDRQLRRMREICDEPDLANDRYRLVRKIGRGGMGTVWLAEDGVLERRVALKVISIEGAGTSLEKRLEREAKIHAALEHPGIVPIHDLGALPDGRTYYAMKYVEGATLDRWREGRPTFEDRVRLVARLAEIVAFAHSKGVVHKDLKPGNVMVGAFGEVFVMDWGIAAARTAATEEAPVDPGPPPTEPSTSERARIIEGTPSWMAPEQAAGDAAAIGPAADIWALGMVLRFLTAGSEAAASLPRGVSKRLRAVIGLACRERTEERYAEAAAFGADLLALLDRRPVAAYPETLLDRGMRWLDANRFLVFLVLGYIVLRAVVLWFWRR